MQVEARGDVDVLSEEGIVNGFIVTVYLTEDEAEAFMATFDPTSASSPTAIESRSLAKPMVVAMIDWTNGG